MDTFEIFTKQEVLLVGVGDIFHLLPCCCVTVDTCVSCSHGNIGHTANVSLEEEINNSELYLELDKFVSNLD